MPSPLVTSTTGFEEALVGSLALLWCCSCTLSFLRISACWRLEASAWFRKLFFTDVAIADRNLVPSETKRDRCSVNCTLVSLPDSNYMLLDVYIYKVVLLLLHVLDYFLSIVK